MTELQPTTGISEQRRSKTGFLNETIAPRRMITEYDPAATLKAAQETNLLVQSC